MGWTLGRNLPVTSGRKALLSSAIVLSAMILLLWVSRSADPGVALAAEGGADGNQETNERCLLAIPCWLSDGTPVGAQASGEQFNQTQQASGILLGSNGVETNERCLLPGIPCFQDSINAQQFQPASVQGTQELRTY